MGGTRLIFKFALRLLSQAGQLHAMPLEGFWMDIGQPKDYLTGAFLDSSYECIGSEDTLARVTYTHYPDYSF